VPSSAGYGSDDEAANVANTSRQTVYIGRKKADAPSAIWATLSVDKSPVLIVTPLGRALSDSSSPAGHPTRATGAATLGAS